MIHLRLATRASPLAMWQARHAARHLRVLLPRCRVTLVPLTSTGDQDLETPLYGMGNIGVFATEVHNAVIRGEADIGVHSCKDLPTTPPDQLIRPRVLPRHDPRDCLVGARTISDLPANALVGTSSARRMAQLRARRPDLRFGNIRGNVATRYGKVQAGEFDATILAAAGLKRLGKLRAYGGTPIPTDEMVPSPAQGAVALDCRRDRPWLQRLLDRCQDRDTATAITLERHVLAGLRGGCSLPLGCHAWRQRGRWHLQARLGDHQRPHVIDSLHAGPVQGLAAAVLQDVAPGAVNEH